MLEDTINQQQLDMVEVLYHPRGFAETMFSVGDNLTLFDPDKFLEIRMAQIPLLGFDHLIDYDSKLNEKQNFARRERAGNIAVFGGRNWGKTFIVEQLDFNQYAVCTENENAGFSSFDYGHLSGVLDKMHLVWMKHPIISSFCERAIRGDYQFSTKFGITIEGINMKVSAGASAGDGFFQKHLKRLWVEEASMESDIVYDKRADSKHEIGIIERLAGMTNFVRNSPAGTVFYEPKEAYRVVNLPQFCNPNYDERQDQERIKKWGGKEASGYKIFVKGEVCEDGENVFDMKDVRGLCYPHTSKGELDEKRTIKHIEITKKKFIKFKNYLSLIRPTNADTLYVAADIGQKGGITEIILIAGTKEKFKYLYNITLINLTKPQQYDIFKHIVQTVNVDYLALDSTGGTGEAIYSDMQVDKVFKNVKLIWVAFNSNVPIGIDLDDNGNPIRKGGKIQEKMVNSVTQSVTRLCHLFYNALIFLPYDSRLDEQLDKVVSLVSKATHKVLYKCFKEGKKILTHKGWNDITDINYNYKFATLDVDNNRTTYKKPKNIIHYDYEGELIEYNGKNLKFAVTPNHQMLIEKPHNFKRKKNKKEFIDAKDLISESRIIRSFGDYKGKDSEFFEFKDYYFRYKKYYKKVPMGDWLSFLGWFVSEGSITNSKKNRYRIAISQRNQKNIILIKKTLDNLQLSYWESTDNIILSSKWLYNWLDQHCYSVGNIKNSKTKKTPNFIRDLNKNYLKIFLEAAIRGDGCFVKNTEKWNSYISSSYKLAEDIQELSIKCGHTSSINKIIGSGFKKDSIYYSVNFGKLGKYSRILKKHLKKVFYKGKVHCIEIEPFHTIYVKYKDKAFWCGNCIAKEDHLWQAFQVFSIAQWLVEYGKLSKPKGNGKVRDKIGAI